MMSLPYVWRHDGLMVGWQKYLARKELDVEVWQVYVNGQKPDHLPGSRDDRIVVEMPEEPARSAR
jgi:hypothetical protein